MRPFLPTPPLPLATIFFFFLSHLLPTTKSPPPLKQWHQEGRNQESAQGDVKSLVRARRCTSVFCCVFDPLPACGRCKLRDMQQIPEACWAAESCIFIPPPIKRVKAVCDCLLCVFFKNLLLPANCTCEDGSCRQ